MYSETHYQMFLCVDHTENNMAYKKNDSADIKWIQYETLNDTMNSIRDNPNTTQAVSMM